MLAPLRKNTLPSSSSRPTRDPVYTTVPTLFVPTWENESYKLNENVLSAPNLGQNTNWKMKNCQHVLFKSGLKLFSRVMDLTTYHSHELNQALLPNECVYRSNFSSDSSIRFLCRLFRRVKIQFALQHLWATQFNRRCIFTSLLIALSEKLLILTMHSNLK